MAASLKWTRAAGNPAPHRVGGNLQSETPSQQNSKRLSWTAKVKRLLVLRIVPLSLRPRNPTSITVNRETQLATRIIYIGRRQWAGSASQQELENVTERGRVEHESVLTIEVKNGTDVDKGVTCALGDRW